MGSLCSVIVHCGFCTAVPDMSLDVCRLVGCAVVQHVVHLSWCHYAMFHFTAVGAVECIRCIYLTLVGARHDGAVPVCF